MQVNGEAIETAQRQLSASYGPVTAADCALVLAGNSDLECGAFQKLIVQPRNLQHGELCIAIQPVKFHLSIMLTNPEIVNCAICSTKT